MKSETGRARPRLNSLIPMKPYRQSIIRQLVEREAITSQEQLRSRLRDRGIDFDRPMRAAG